MICCPQIDQMNSDFFFLDRVVGLVLKVRLSE